jgi:hypothetical protein
MIIHAEELLWPIFVFKYGKGRCLRVPFGSIEGYGEAVAKAYTKANPSDPAAAKCRQADIEAFAYERSMFLIKEDGAGKWLEVKAGVTFEDIDRLFITKRMTRALANALTAKEPLRLLHAIPSA